MKLKHVCMILLCGYVACLSASEFYPELEIKYSFIVRCSNGHALIRVYTDDSRTVEYNNVKADEEAFVEKNVKLRVQEQEKNDGK